MGKEGATDYLCFPHVQVMINEVGDQVIVVQVELISWAYYSIVEGVGTHLSFQI